MNHSRHPTVSVIVPSTGRASLARAVSSAINQQHVTVRVAIPGTADSLRKAEASLASILEHHHEQIEFMCLPPGASGGKGRAIATAKAQSDYVAYLDDDDWWHPTKSAKQIAAFGDGTVLVSCRSLLINAAHPDVAPALTPKSLYDPQAHGEVSDYLFRNRRLAAGRNLLHTSTLLVDTAAAQAANWDPSLVRHQDWDFVLSLASKFGGHAITQLAEPLAYLETGTASSVSAKPDWRPSHEWYTANQTAFSDPAAADFLVGQVGRYALQAGHYKHGWALLSEARRRHRPSPSSVAIMLSGILPRHFFEQIAFAIERLRQSFGSPPVLADPR